jgi:putative NADH-flavin reductase
MNVNAVNCLNNKRKADHKHNDYMENIIKLNGKSKRHRVLILGDSHTRGCADLLKLSLNREFGVSGMVKPGAKSNDISGTNIDKNMTKDDIVVACAGTTDISKNNSKEGLRNIIKFVKRTSHTNIIVLGALHRH